MKYLLFLMLVLLLLSCSDHSSIIINDEMTQFVPKDSTTKYFTYDTAVDNDDVLVSWATETLFSLKEPVISTYSGEGEFVRFVWLRAFENPIVIRLNKFGDTVYASIKELNLRERKIIRDTIITLDKGKWNEFITPLNQNGFWNASYADDFFGQDGATWYLECRLNNQYKVIQRWDYGNLSSPELQSYLGPLIDFTNTYVRLKSAR